MIPKLLTSFATFFAGLFLATAHADHIETLIESSCIACHDENTETRLDFTKLDRNFEDTDTFRAWVNIVDRIRKGEMPPAPEPRPDTQTQTAALTFLKTKLTKVNRRQQQNDGRVPSRRISRHEYEHTLHDLLGIGGDIARYLPPETKWDAFDVVTAKQDMSSVHIKGFLKAADVALDEAIQLGPKPRMVRELDYANSQYMKMWFQRPVRRGGGTVFRAEDDLIMFRGENHNLRSDYNGLRFPVAGRYRITVTGSAYQPRSSVTMSLKRQNDIQGDSELFAAWDVDEKLRTVSTIKYMRPDDFFYVSADELEPAPDGKVIYNSQPASEFKGEGVRVRKVLVEGPLESTWPPQRTRDLFPDVQWEPVPNGRYYKPVTTKPHYEHIRDAVAALAPRAFRRPVTRRRAARDDVPRASARRRPGHHAGRCGRLWARPARGRAPVAPTLGAGARVHRRPRRVDGRVRPPAGVGADPCRSRRAGSRLAAGLRGDTRCLRRGERARCRSEPPTQQAEEEPE